jgi:hypothetical protein
MSDEDWMKDWGGDLYRDPDYVEGSHPMDRDEVTWHHVWGKSPVESPPLADQDQAAQET